MRGTRRQGRHAPAHARREREPKAKEAGSRRPPAAAPAGIDEEQAARATGGRASEEAQQQDTQAWTAPALRDASSEPREPGEPARRVRDGRDEAPLQTGRAVLRGVAHRDRVLTSGGARLRLLVLACTPEDTTAVDIASGGLLRLRIPWAEGQDPDLSPFDVVEATLADDPELDDLAQPEAATVATLPRHVGSLRGRRARRMLARLAVAPDGPLLGFNGPSAPYWDFRGLRPSVALVHPTRDPQLLRRPADNSTWIRFGWHRADVWLPVEQASAGKALAASRRDQLGGKALATALGFHPNYLVVAVSRPRGGHCYKVCAAILPRG